ncbi:hypothetical protein N7530_010686, partial [Penicillium desertorum]
NSRETLLFRGLDPNRSNIYKSTKGTKPDNSVSTRDLAPIRLYILREIASTIWLLMPFYSKSLALSIKPRTSIAI